MRTGIFLVLLVSLALSRVSSSLAQDADADGEVVLRALEPFQLDRPWLSLEEAPEYVRRNRGVAATLAGLLNSSALQPAHREQIVGDYRELVEQKGKIVEVAGKIDRERGELYRKMLALDLLRFFVEVISEGKHSCYFSGTNFKDYYYSRAEGRSQAFQVLLPPGFRADGNYPLFVQMRGPTSLLPTKARPFIRIRPTGKGVWGYRSISRLDIMQAIAVMTSGYPVDEKRVYMTGTSAGATGVMHAAAYRQDIFAGVVPLVAFGTDLPLENFRNLPLRCEHGVNDWTSAICNVRVQFQKLAALDYDAVLNEHPTAGHGIPVPPPKTMEWLFQQQRNPQAKQIVHTCEHPRDGRAEWLAIEALLDPHAIARIEANCDATGLSVRTENVRRFSIDLEVTPYRTGQRLLVDSAAVNVSAPEGSKRLTLRQGNGWSASVTAKTEAGRRAYGAGAAANLFQGEPLLVVYGTGGDQQENEFLQRAASLLARAGGPHFRSASVQYRVAADTQADELPLEHYNLLLVGTPEENAYLRKLAVKFPYQIERGVLKVGDRVPLKLAASVLSFHFYNPEHPQRLVYVVSPYLAEAERESFLENPRHFLAGSEGFKMIDQPDLLVRGVDRRLRREMQLDAEWKFLPIAGAERPAPLEFSDRTQLAMAHLKVMHRKEKVDFALWWGPEDKGLFGGYDFNWLPTLQSPAYTMADYLVRRRGTEIMTGTLPGEELRDIHKRWIATQELVTWPPVKLAELDNDRQYRIAIPMDLVPKLGNRHRVLSKVAAGADVLPTEVAEQVFGDRQP